MTTDIPEDDILWNEYAEQVHKEANKMEGYNPNNVEVQKSLRPGIMVDAVVIDIKDGKVKDFVKEDTIGKWQNADQTCIQVTFEGKHEDQSVLDMRLFTYYVTDNKKTRYTERSNLGKYAKYYGKPPAVGDKVQMKTNADGYFKVVIE